LTNVIAKNKNNMDWSIPVHVCFTSLPSGKDLLLAKMEPIQSRAVPDKKAGSSFAFRPKFPLFPCECPEKTGFSPALQIFSQSGTKWLP
jgi:hypothetical protein